MKKQLVTVFVTAGLMIFCLFSTADAMGNKTAAPSPQSVATQSGVDEELPVIDAQVANQLHRGGKAVFVDALNPEVYRLSHIPNAVNIPGEAPQMKMKNLASVKHDDIIVVYCANPDCGAAKRTAKYLISEGFSQVYYFKGGKQAWQDAGYRLSR